MAARPESSEAPLGTLNRNGPIAAVCTELARSSRRATLHSDSVSERAVSQNIFCLPVVLDVHCALPETSMLQLRVQRVLEDLDKPPVLFHDSDHPECVEVLDSGVHHCQGLRKIADEERQGMHEARRIASRIRSN